MIKINNKKIKWGVIGSGGIAKRRTIPEGIMPAQNAELIAVYDVDLDINSVVANQTGAIAAGSIDELLDLDIDAVYIATPVYLHHNQAMKCAEKHKHVLCEKPLGLNVFEAKNMIKLFRNENLLLGTGLMMRYQSQHRAAFEMIKSGKIGKPVYARTQLSCWYPQIENAWRQNPAMAGGGSLIDMGAHCIDLLEMFFGKILKVSCFVNNSVHNYKSEDSACVMLFFENGAMGTVDTFFCIPDESSKNRLELYGSNGSILAENTIGQGSQGKMKVYLNTISNEYDAKQTRTVLDGIEICPEPVNMYKAEIEEFSSAIINKNKSYNDAEIGLRNQKIIEACYLSAKTQKTINIE